LLLNQVFSISFWAMNISKWKC